VLLLQAEGARSVLAEGLKRRRAELRSIVAYRSVDATEPGRLQACLRGADAVLFSSGSTARHSLRRLEAEGARAALEGVEIVSIGPVTSAALRGLGVTALTEAAPHDLDGLVAATVEAVTSGGTS